MRASAPARINGVALHAMDEMLAPDELRQRACTELLRQAAQAAGLLDANDAPSADGVISEAAATAIDTLLEQNLNVPEPSEEACRRHHAAHQSAYRTGERVRVRHILFGALTAYVVLLGSSRTMQIQDAWNKISFYPRQHRILSDGRAGAIALGQSPDDDPGADFLAGDCSTGGTGSKYTLMPLLRIASFLALAILIIHDRNSSTIPRYTPRVSLAYSSVSSHSNCCDPMTYQV